MLKEFPSRILNDATRRRYYFMPDYQNLYAYLVGEIDKALTHMDNNDLLEWDHVKRILQNALWEAEERVTGGEEEVP